MNVQALKEYQSRPLPKQREFRMDSSFEKPSSNRLQQAARLAGSCAALQWLLGCSPDAEQSTVPVVPSALSPDQNHSENEQPAAAQRVPQVIPILEEALVNDGRGAFGCMCIDPPAFLSEDDALDLIRKEFAKAGLKLDNQAPIVADVAKPETTTHRSIKTAADGEYMRDAEGNYIYEPLAFHPREPLQFDLSFDNQTIRIEYIGKKDYGTWQSHSMIRSSVDSYNFSDTARRLRDSLVAQDDLESGVYGIFFDPLETPETRPQYPDMVDMTEEERELARQAYRSASAKAAKVASQPALQKQIDHFLAVLREEGLIETPVP